MAKELIDFLSEFKSFTNEEIAAMVDMMNVKNVPKNTLLVEEGKVCSLCFFVLKGCLRQYVLQDGLEKTTAFYTEYQAVNFFTSTTAQTAAGSNLVTLEASVLLIGSPERDKELYARVPALEQITRQMMERNFGETQDSFAKFMTSSPEERYLNILEERPDLIQRVSQYQLASYLGVTPESLSRIRKRVALR